VGFVIVKRQKPVGW